MEGPSRPIRLVTCACCIAASLALLPSAYVAAGESAEIAPGKWVRITTGSGVAAAKPRTVIEGTVQSLDEKTLVLGRPGQGPILVPRDSISSVDVRRRESKKGLGVVIGLIAGGGIGYAVGAATSGPGCQGRGIDFPLCTLNEVGKPAGAILGAVGGAVLGLLIAPGAKWEKNLHLDHVHVGLGPTRHRGIGLSISVAF